LSEAKLSGRGGMNEAVLKAQTNECRGGGFLNAFISTTR
jgi:hypothetical protein